MKTKNKIKLDKYLGLPLALALNVIARVAGFILQIDHSLKKPLKTIVISKFEGMGSIIQCTPLLQSLKASYPETKIIFVSKFSNRALLKQMPFISEIITIDESGFFNMLDSVSHLILKLWKLRADVYIDLEVHSNFSGIIATMSLARNRLGFFKSEKNYKMGLFTHMMFFNQKASISEVYLQFARLLDCPVIITSLYKLQPGPEIKMIAEKQLQDWGLARGDKYIVINPNASDLRLERRWPAQNYSGLIKNFLLNKPGYRVVLIGNKQEAVYINNILAEIRHENLINTAGRISFETLIHLIENADLLVTNDTGPMHLGFAQGTKTLALFGPCSPAQYGKEANTYTIYKNVYCSPCVHEFFIPPCKGNNQCMKLISIEEVLFLADSALNDLPIKSIKNEIIYRSEFTLGQVLRK